MIQDKIEWGVVFGNLPKITGLPLKLIGNKFYGACYIDGRKHNRWDKTMARLLDDGIQILEQGGESMTLWNWMIRYGGCGSSLEVRNSFLNLSPSQLMFDDEIDSHWKAKRHISWSVYQEQSKLIGQIEDPMFKFLVKFYGHKETLNAYRKYHVTPVVCRDGSIGTQFWYINARREICSDKIMFYKSDGHRDRDKSPKNRFKSKYGYTDKCLFGEHMTIGKTECVKVVESEKSAMICYLEYGGCWVATGGMNGLALLDKIKDKRVYLVPDIDAIDLWRESGQIWEWWKKCEGIGRKWDIADWILLNKNK
ncbi:MAG: DUF6371 domain-containing protein [Bacteroidaceae bacterium]